MELLSYINDLIYCFLLITAFLFRNLGDFSNNLHLSILLLDLLCLYRSFFELYELGLNVDINERNLAEIFEVLEVFRERLIAGEKQECKVYVQLQQLDNYY